MAFAIIFTGVFVGLALFQIADKLDDIANNLRK